MSFPRPVLFIVSKEAAVSEADKDSKKDEEKEVVEDAVEDPVCRCQGIETPVFSFFRANSL